MIARIPAALLLHVLSVLVAAAVIAPSFAADVPLAVVGDDTVTTRQLDIQLSIMKQRMPEGSTASLPDADAVLRRLVQNQLVVQEGYRMGMHEHFSVSNQVTEAVRDQSAKALLDSVAAAVPDDAPDVREERKQAVAGFIDDLMVEYSVVVDSTLLRSLDFATDDGSELTALRQSEDVLASLPSGQVRVRHLARAIRFREYHGLRGKPDAAERRDRIFRELLVESLLRYEARQRGVDRSPAVRRLHDELEQQLVLEETMKSLLQSDYRPDDAAIEAWYRENIAMFTPEAGVRLDGAKFSEREAAEVFRDRLLAGAKLDWLKRNTPDVMDGPAPFPPTFVAPGMIGMDAADIAVGHVPDIYEVPDGFVVAVVTALQPVEPQPLDEVRSRIAGMMQAEHTRTRMDTILARLEEATAVTILPDALDLTADTIARTLGSGTPTEAP
jgi:hypothetical protein